MTHELLFGFSQLFTPEAMGLLVAGMAICMFMGMLPGMGVSLALSLMLPFLYHMSVIPAITLMLATGAVTTLVVRGPDASGRLTLLGSIAARLGRDTLVHEGQPDDEGWRLLGPLAALGGAVTVTVAEDVASGRFSALRNGAVMVSVMV